MPLLEAEANKLTNPSLTKGVVELFQERGSGELLKQLLFKPVQGSSYDWVVEKSIPTGNSARNPYGGTPIPGGVGSRTRVDVKVGHLMRNADTAKIDKRVKSDINDLHAEDIKLAAKRLMRDFRTQFVHGNGSYQKGTGYNLPGLDYYLDLFAGKYANGSLVASTYAGFSDRKAFATADGTPYGAAQTLDLAVLEDITTRFKGDGFDVLYSDRKTAIEFKNILNAAPGNMATTFMDPMFGRPTTTFNGLPWIILDTIGQEKASSEDVNASVSIAANGTITVNAMIDPYFIGFTDLDIGRTYTLYNLPPSLGGTVLKTGTITDVISDFVAETAAGAAAGPGYLVLEETSAIYGARYGESDGVAAIYGAAPGASTVNAGEYETAIAGFEAEQLGMMDDAPLYRTRLDWIGSFVVHDPNAIVRLSHYSL